MSETNKVAIWLQGSPSGIMSEANERFFIGSIPGRDSDVSEQSLLSAVINTIMSQIICISENEIEADPFAQFDNLYKKHLLSGATIANSVSLGTSDNSGNVSVRTVLLKEFSVKGFVFFTNYKSRKSLQLKLNPRSALLFYWPELSCQVRIEGVTNTIPEDESIKYFNKRPRESQISAWASEQSSVIPDREYLENKYRYYENIFSGINVNKPEFWGGYRLIPDWFEFWSEGHYRLHDRLSYTLENESWIIRRLAP